MEALEFAGRAGWHAWLARNHSVSDGVWVRIAKKSARPSVTHPEALEIALCYGWIDGKRKSDGELAWLQWFGPRRKRSVWSKVNRAKALELIASGAMQPAGVREVERARADGRWEAAYDSAKTAVLPQDLAAALEANLQAKAFFARLNAQNRYAVLHRIQTAKLPRTRARRISKFVEMLGKGETLHPM